MHRLVCVCVSLLLGACSPAGETPAAPAGADVATPRNPFFGSWRMNQTRMAPWWSGEGPEPMADPAFSGLRLAAGSVEGPPGVSCAQPGYATDIVSLSAVFGGRLNGPSAQALGLGLGEPSPTVLSLTCRSAPERAEVTFVMADPDTILLAAGDRIYTYVRTGR